MSGKKAWLLITNILVIILVAFYSGHGLFIDEFINKPNLIVV